MRLLPLVVEVSGSTFAPPRHALYQRYRSREALKRKWRGITTRLSGTGAEFALRY